MRQGPFTPISRLAVGVLSGGTLGAIAVLVALYTVGATVMPGVLWWLFAIIAAIALVINVTLLGFQAPRLVAWVRDTWGLQWPLYLKGRPNPYEWLFHIASEDAENPASRILMFGHEIVLQEFWNDAKRPWIDIGVYVYNGTVYDVQLGAPEGRILYKGQALPESPIPTPWGNFSRGRAQQYRLRQYLTPETGIALHEEKVANAWTIKSLELSNVRIAVSVPRVPGASSIVSIGGPKALRGKY